MFYKQHISLYDAYNTYKQYKIPAVQISACLVAERATSHYLNQEWFISLMHITQSPKHTGQMKPNVLTHFERKKIWATF